MISVIMPTKNGEKYISKSIESVLSQTEKDLELIIIDDGSIDSIPSVLKGWAEKDKRIKIMTNSLSLGTGRSRAWGIQNSQFPFIALIDDDDIWTDKEKLSKQKVFLEQNPGCVLVGSKTVKEINENGDFLGNYTNLSSDEEIRKKMLFKDCFITSSVMFRKESYNKVGGFRDIYRAEDYDLWLRMGRIGKIANIDTEMEYRNIKGLRRDPRHLEWYRAIAQVIEENKDFYPGYPLAYWKAQSRFIYFWLFGGTQGTWIDRTIRKIVRKAM